MPIRTPLATPCKSLARDDTQPTATRLAVAATSTTGEDHALGFILGRRPALDVRGFRAAHHGEHGTMNHRQVRSHEMTARDVQVMSGATRNSTANRRPAARPRSRSSSEADRRRDQAGGGASRSEYRRAVGLSCRAALPNGRRRNADSTARSSTQCGRTPVRMPRSPAGTSVSVHCCAIVWMLRARHRGLFGRVLDDLGGRRHGKIRHLGQVCDPHR